MTLSSTSIPRLGGCSLQIWICSPLSSASCKLFETEPSVSQFPTYVTLPAEIHNGVTLNFRRKKKRTPLTSPDLSPCQVMALFSFQLKNYRYCCLFSSFCTSLYFKCSWSPWKVLYKFKLLLFVLFRVIF